MDQSIGSIVAVIASTVLTARIITGQSNERALSRTPTDLKSGTTVKYCHTFLSKPASWNSSRKMDAREGVAVEHERGHDVGDEITA